MFRFVGRSITVMYSDMEKYTVLMILIISFFLYFVIFVVDSLYAFFVCWLDYTFSTCNINNFILLFFYSFIRYM